MSKHKEISDKDILKIAMAIIDLLIATGEWFDTCVYFLNHAFCTNGYFHYRKPAYYIFRTSGEKVEKICVISNVRAAPRWNFEYRNRRIFKLHLW